MLLLIVASIRLYLWELNGVGMGEAVMAKAHRPKSSQPIDPRAVFELAYRFCLADEHIRDGKNLKAPIMAAPSMVLSAFASELLLKCLLLIENKEVDTTHSLNRLYQKISHTQKRRIDSAWEAEARPHIDSFCRIHGLPSDLANALVTCGRAFEQLRYGYEAPEGEGQRFYIGHLPRILCEAIIEIKPEWRATGL